MKLIRTKINGPKILKNETEKKEKRYRKRRPWAPFWIILGAVLGAFWDQKWDRGRPLTDFSGKSDMYVSYSNSYTKQRFWGCRESQK